MNVKKHPKTGAFSRGEIKKRYCWKYASYTVSKTQADGKYYFYAVDGLGNTSATVYVELNVEVPSIEIVRSIPENSVYVTWTESGYIKEVKRMKALRVAGGVLGFGARLLIATGLIAWTFAMNVVGVLICAI